MSADHQDDEPDLRVVWAEERTLLGIARTYGSWLRTGMGAIGVALGMQVVFRDPEHVSLGRVAATLFLAIAVALFVGGDLQAHRLQKKLASQHRLPVRNRYWPITAVLVIASALVAVLFWRA